MRALIALMLLMMLGGCWWEGPIFYPPDPARVGPLQPGVYQAAQADGKTERVRLSRTPDGSYRNESGKADDAVVVFAPLTLPGRDLWITEIISTDPAKTGAMYGLLERRGDSADLLPLLMCDETAEIVRAAGGIVTQAEEPSPPTCRFETREALERGLIAYAKQNARLPHAATLRRIGD